jgi:hypothetical protein
MALLCLVNGEGKRFDAAASVGAIAKGLRIRVTAGAPIMLALLQFDAHGLLRGNSGCDHVLPL